MVDSGMQSDANGVPHSKNSSGAHNWGKEFEDYNYYSQKRVLFSKNWSDIYPSLYFQAYANVLSLKNLHLPATGTRSGMITNQLDRAEILRDQLLAHYQASDDLEAYTTLSNNLIRWDEKVSSE